MHSHSQSGEEGGWVPWQAPFRSISKKYCADLENLLQTLSKCQIHYISSLTAKHDDDDDDDDDDDGKTL